MKDLFGVLLVFINWSSVCQSRITKRDTANGNFSKLWKSGWSLGPYASRHNYPLKTIAIRPDPYNPSGISRKLYVDPTTSPTFGMNFKGYAAVRDSSQLPGDKRRIGHGDGDGWGEDDGPGLGETFAEVITGKINTITSTITGIKSAVKGVKRGAAKKIARKIEGFGDFVSAITKGASGVFKNKGASKGWGNGNEKSPAAYGWSNNVNEEKGTRGNGGGWRGGNDDEDDDDYRGGGGWGHDDEDEDGRGSWRGSDKDQRELGINGKDKGGRWRGNGQRGGWGNLRGESGQGGGVSGWGHNGNDNNGNRGWGNYQGSPNKWLNNNNQGGGGYNNNNGQGWGQGINGGQNNANAGWNGRQWSNNGGLQGWGEGQNAGWPQVGGQGWTDNHQQGSHNVLSQYGKLQSHQQYYFNNNPNQLGLYGQTPGIGWRDQSASNAFL